MSDADGVHAAAACVDVKFLAIIHNSVYRSSIVKVLVTLVLLQ